MSTGGDVGRTLYVGSDGKHFAVAERGKVFGIELFDHGEAAELALEAVEKSMVVGIRTDEAIAADEVVGLDALHRM